VPQREHGVIRKEKRERKAKVKGWSKEGGSVGRK